MKIKLNKTQLDGVELLLGHLIISNRPTNKAERLVYVIVKKSYDKVRLKSEMLQSPRAGYGIHLSELEALALIIFLETVHIPEKLYPFEALQLNSITNQIDQAYAGIDSRLGAAAIRPCLRSIS